MSRPIRAGGAVPVRRAVALLLGAALSLAPGGTLGRGAAPRMPGPEPPRNLDPVAVNRDCERCHAEIAREWRGSKHQRAYVDAPFQAALAKERARREARGAERACCGLSPRATVTGRRPEAISTARRSALRPADALPDRVLDLGRERAQVLVGEAA
ncbi:multiheme c-type cytochrome [Sorangium sp. So ce394]|uniref:multiheme c-type cytochrome n=1 Tax=Sorangium sp. So ce394 TaxID=3133310 RepID=UPI003F5C6E46